MFADVAHLAMKYERAREGERKKTAVNSPGTGAISRDDSTSSDDLGRGGSGEEIDTRLTLRKAYPVCERAGGGWRISIHNTSKGCNCSCEMYGNCTWAKLLPSSGRYTCGNLSLSLPGNWLLTGEEGKHTFFTKPRRGFQEAIDDCSIPRTHQQRPISVVSERERERDQRGAKSASLIFSREGLCLSYRDADHMAETSILNLTLPPEHLRDTARSTCVLA